MLAIIALHCQLFMSYMLYNDTPLFGYLFNQCMRFAVPFFFLISGYLIHPKLSQAPLGTLKTYSLPLLKIWGMWSVISLLMPFNWQTLSESGYLVERQGYWDWLLTNPINTLFEGGLVHLWFIPALLIAVAIIAISIHLNKVSWLFPLSLLLYLYGLLGGSYLPLTDFWTPFFTRNGPFFSTLLVVIGFYIRKRNISINSLSALLLIFVGLGVHLSEAAYLVQFDTPFNVHDFLIGTPIFALGLFFYCLANPNLGSNTFILKISELTLGVYVSHLLIIIILSNVIALFGIEHFARDAILFFGTVVLSYSFVWFCHQTRAKQWLFR